MGTDKIRNMIVVAREMEKINNRSNLYEKTYDGIIRWKKVNIKQLIYMIQELYSSNVFFIKVHFNFSVLFKYVISEQIFLRKSNINFERKNKIMSNSDTLDC